MFLMCLSVSASSSFNLFMCLISIHVCICTCVLDICVRIRVCGTNEAYVCAYMYPTMRMSVSMSDTCDIGVYLVIYVYEFVYSCMWD